MRKWIVGGASVAVVALIGLVATLVLFRGSTRFDDRAYPGSSWGETPDEVFTDFAITLPECTDGRMRYWTGKSELYLKIAAPPTCIGEFIEVNRLKGSPPGIQGPVALVNSAKRADEFGWQSSADHSYTRYRREEKNVETQAMADDAADERSLFLNAWHQ
ncbi:hypothetical protein QLQ12_44360 [Actinoplanes sp. NEAU-A12]|uniref:Uncharacterized protein n=1 Tax=Actinoplanes sandaracinus TaxID=3045177 RepID=A0ABT6X108_9ACTN|nr:hypothetical protein [Actinoplanes sandaracinus]MDI6105637.1 hypothetical protein [Actinoplanes sandaracinus]